MQNNPAARWRGWVSSLYFGEQFGCEHSAFISNLAALEMQFPEAGRKVSLEPDFFRTLDDRVSEGEPFFVPAMFW